MAAGLSEKNVALMGGASNGREVLETISRYRQSIGFERAMPLASLVLDAVQSGWLSEADAPLPDQQFDLATAVEKNSSTMYEADSRPRLKSGRLAARAGATAVVGAVRLTAREMQLVHGTMSSLSNQALAELLQTDVAQVQQEGKRLVEKFGLGSWAHLGMEIGVHRIDFSQHFAVPRVAEVYDRPYEFEAPEDALVMVDRLPFELEVDGSTRVIFERDSSSYINGAELLSTTTGM